MKLLGRVRLNAFARKHADAREALFAWAAEVDDATWPTSVELRKRYPSASVITKGRVVFNIKGNKYRLDASVDFRNQIVVVRRVGTHAEYNSWSFK